MYFEYKYQFFYFYFFNNVIKISYGNAKSILDYFTGVIYLTNLNLTEENIYHKNPRS